MTTQAVVPVFQPLLEDLPESLREIAEAFGYDVAEIIRSNFAGIRLFVPKRLSDGHRLIGLLGEEMARRLSHHFGGETLFIPRGAQAERNQRNQEIIRRYDEGVPVRVMAQEYKLTERQVYSILTSTPTKGVRA